MSQAFPIPDGHFRLATFNVENLFARYSGGGAEQRGPMGLLKE